MSYGTSSKKQYEQRPPVTSPPSKRFKPGKPKDYEEQLVKSSETSE